MKQPGRVPRVVETFTQEWQGKLCTEVEFTDAVIAFLRAEHRAVVRLVKRKQEQYGYYDAFDDLLAALARRAR